jgi:hypothetical protein
MIAETIEGKMEDGCDLWRCGEALDVAISVSVKPIRAGQVQPCIFVAAEKLFTAPF